MSKRKAAESLSQKELNLNKKSYKGGSTKDIHHAIFQKAQIMCQPQRVLYPGCHRHLTAALVFETFTFVDCDAKIKPFHRDQAVVDYVEAEKVYPGDSTFDFARLDIHQATELDTTYDMAILLSAGSLEAACAKHVISRGWLLTNDAHSDARAAFVSDSWDLYAYWFDNEFCSNDIERCFRVIVDGEQTRGISKAQVRESLKGGTVKRRSFKLLFEPMFFLFKNEMRYWNSWLDLSTLTTTESSPQSFKEVDTWGPLCSDTTIGSDCSNRQEQGRMLGAH